MMIVTIAWMYVVLMMALAEAFSSSGSVLGAIFTFLLYGVLPLSIVLYVMGTPARRRARSAATPPSPPDSQA
jgi:mannose/fructose/N-acetylgalactosamine-specific phosphotransferase system component IID